QFRERSIEGLPTNDRHEVVPLAPCSRAPGALRFTRFGHPLGSICNLFCGAHLASGFGIATSQLCLGLFCTVRGLARLLSSGRRVTRSLCIFLFVFERR